MQSLMVIEASDQILVEAAAAFWQGAWAWQAPSCCNGRLLLGAHSKEKHLRLSWAAEDKGASFQRVNVVQSNSGPAPGAGEFRVLLAVEVRATRPANKIVTPLQRRIDAAVRASCSGNLCQQWS
jgi:hypothetical protein